MEYVTKSSVDERFSDEVESAVQKSDNERGDGNTGYLSYWVLRI